MSQCVVVCCRVLQNVAKCCNMLQHVAECCNTLHVTWHELSSRGHVHHVVLQIALLFIQRARPHIKCVMWHVTLSEGVMSHIVYQSAPLFNKQVMSISMINPPICALIHRMSLLVHVTCHLVWRSLVTCSLGWVLSHKESCRTKSFME